jgi:hypothetical protein
MRRAVGTKIGTKNKHFGTQSKPPPIIMKAGGGPSLSARASVGQELAWIAIAAFSPLESVPPQTLL